MKQIINDYYLAPYPKEFVEHFRNGLNEEYLTIFDSISTRKGDSNFHYDNTMYRQNGLKNFCAEWCGHT